MYIGSRVKAGGRSKVGGDLSPISLFLTGAQGVWFDRQDLSSMYQDSSGATPCAVGSPVGLALDKSKGAVRGSEQLANPGGPFTATTGWVPNGSTLAVVGGELEVTAGAAAGRAEVAFPMTQGTAYEIVAMIRKGTAPSASVQMIRGAGGSFASLGTQSTTNGTTTLVSLIVIAAATESGFFQLISPSGAGTVYASSLSVRPIPGNHATQGTAASRPILRQDASGRYYLEYDGVDDGMATGSIDFTGTNNVSVFAGVQKASDAATQIILELSADASANPAFNLLVPALGLYRARFTGTLSATVDSVGAASPTPHVVSAQANIAGPSQSIRVNGSPVTTAVTMGTGNFGNFPLNIGRRNALSLPYNGRDYGLIVVGRALSATEIARAERFLASRMGIAI